MPPGEYKLNCEGLSGTDFHQKKPLEFQSKNASIFVQSDKAIYKPGDTIHFRVLVLDMNLKPMSNRDGIKIYITVSLIIIALVFSDFRFQNKFYDFRMGAEIASRNGIMFVQFEVFLATN